MPSNGLSLLYGISISNVTYKRLDNPCYMCLTGGRASTGGYASTGVCVRYSVAVAVALWPCAWCGGLWWWLWGCGGGCGAVLYVLA